MSRMLSTVKGKDLVQLAIIFGEESMKTRLRVKEIAEQQGFNISTLSRKADVSLTTVRRVWRNPYWKATNEILQRLATTPRSVYRGVNRGCAR